MKKVSAKTTNGTTTTNPAAETTSDARGARAVEEIARAVAAYDESRRVGYATLSEVGETLEQEIRAIALAVGSLQCTLEGDQVIEEDVEAAITALATARESLRICVLGELKAAGVFATAVTS